MDKGMDSVKKAAMLFLLSPILVPAYLIISLVGLVFPVQFTRWFIFNVPGASWQQGDITTEQWQAAHAAAPEVKMPDIGEAVVHDYRPTAQTRLGAVGSVRVCSWNIFLGRTSRLWLMSYLRWIRCPTSSCFKKTTSSRTAVARVPSFGMQVLQLQEPCK